MSYNKMTIIGNLGRDPELRYTPQGDAVCDFSVAVNDRKRDKAGEWQDVTTWFKVTLWGKKAESASKYLTKGRKAYVEGRLQLEEWTDRDGNTRHTLTIQGSEVQFLDGRGDGNDADSSSDSSYSSASSSSSSSSSSNDSFSQESKPSASDDDIPF
jgi:single-strand DNA-binding protein